MEPAAGTPAGRNTVGLFDLIKPNDKKKIEGLVKKVKEPYAQPEVRREAMEGLFKMGTDDALRGVLKRFTFVCQSLHWDGEEKRWLIDELARTGTPAVQPVKDFIHQDDNVVLAIRALEKLLDAQQVTETLISALQARAPDAYRATQAKLEIIDHLGSGPVSDRAWEAVQPYLEDHSDDVRAKVLEVVEGWSLEAAAAQVARLLLDDTLSARVHRQAAQCLCALKARLSPAPVLPPAAQEDYTVDGDGQVIRKRPS